MVNAKEFRIGNIVQTTEGRIGVVKSIAEKKVVLKLKHSTFKTLTKKEFDGLDIEPVPLFGDWLINFGFEKGNQAQFIKGDWFAIFFDKEDFYLWHIIDESELQGIKIKILFVHQLQNLFFALTGEELKMISLPSSNEDNDSNGRNI